MLPQDRERARESIRNAVIRRRQALVYHLARRLHEALNECTPGEMRFSDDVAAGWIRIESLSHLRAVVGGRFQNLKAKWIQAGFPLREHRGDRAGRAKVNQSGWIELSVWINKQGFEVRLAEYDEPWLFELRKNDAG